MKTKVAHQAEQEQKAGYESGLRGDMPPKRDKGRSFYHGWLRGSQDRQDKIAMTLKAAG